VNLFDQIILSLLMLDVIILPLNHRKALHPTAIVLLIFFWVMKMIFLKKWIWRRTFLDIPILLFLLWGLFSSILSTHPRYSIGQFRTEAVTHFFFFYLAVTHIRGKEKVRKILLALMAGSALMASYGIYEFFATGGNWMSRGIRIGSLASDFNYASTYFILVIPLTLFFVLESSRKPFKRSIFLLLFLMNLLSLYFTFTRAAWLGLVISLIVFSFFRGKKTILAAALALGIMMTLLFSTPQGKAFYANMGGSEGGRTPAWEFGIGEILKRPLLGIGYGRGNMQATFPEQQEMYSKGFIHLHNVFLEIALEMGIPGAILLVILIVTLIVQFTMGYLRATDPEDARLMIAMTMIVFAYFTRNQFDQIYVDAPAVLFWLLMGLGVSRLQDIFQRNTLHQNGSTEEEHHATPLSISR
jgi:putative inorganic carbon (HCO3(-)) transporter